MNPYLHKFDPNVTDAHYAEIVDAYRDTRPTRADVDDDPTWPAPKGVRADTPLLAALQAGAERGQA